MEPTESETKARLTLGEFLKQVREANGLSVEYVADQLKLKVSTVRDLEANQYDHLGGLVYIKGYLRSYARLLHLNIEDQLQLNGQNKENTAPPNDLFSNNQKEQSSSWPWLLLCVVVAVVILGALYYAKDKLLSTQHHKELVTSAPQPTTETVKQIDSTPTPSTDKPNLSSDLSVGKPATIEQQVEPQEKPAVDTQTPTPSTDSAPVAE